MNIYKDDLVIALSFLNRFEEDKEYFMSICAQPPEEYAIHYLNGRIKQYLSECALIGFFEMQHILNVLIQSLEKLLNQVDLKELSPLIEYLFLHMNEIKKVFQQQLNATQENIEISIMTDELKILFDNCRNEIEHQIDHPLQTQSFDFKEFQITSEFKTEMNTIIPLLQDNCDTLMHQADTLNYRILINQFDQIKGNVDLLIAATDHDISEDHPIMFIYQFLNHIDDFFDKTKHADVFDQKHLELVKTIISRVVYRLGELIENKITQQDENLLIEQMKEYLQQQRNQVITDKIQQISKESVQPPEVIIETILQTPKDTLPVDPIPVNQKSEDEFVRVRQDYLENISSMISELVVTNSTLSYIQSKLKGNESKATLIEMIQNTEKSFQRLLSDLDQLVLEIRLQKIKELFGRFPRLVRDIAKVQNKKINLELEGEDIELDNIILKQLADPLMHILRNSCDHGIELPEIRKEKGKSESGNIRLSATRIGSKIQISIRDDGAGLSQSVIKQKVLEKNLINPSVLNQLSEKQIFNLIFLPGFSTAKVVTDISGRGVGMDVVQQNIMRVKGEIDISSIEGQFTEIKILLPQSISISKGLLIQTGNEQYIVPLENVLSIEHIPPSEIHAFQEGQFMKYHEEFIELRSLRHILNQEDTIINNIDEKQLCVILSDEFVKKALVIDKVIGIQELSIRVLPENLKHLDIYRGCATLSDGRAILVLNPKKLYSGG